MSHKSDAFDATGLLADANLALPLDWLREMHLAGEIGPLADRHFSFMGSIKAPGRLINETAPEVAAALSASGAKGTGEPDGAAQNGSAGALSQPTGGNDRPHAAGKRGDCVLQLGPRA